MYSLPQSSRIRVLLGLCLGTILGGAVVTAAMTLADDGEASSPHQDEAVGHNGSLPPAILVEAANLISKLEHMAAPDAPCSGGPCLGGDILAVARAAMDRCAKIGGGEFLSENPQLPAGDALVILDRAVSVACQELRGAIRGNDDDAGRAQAVAQARVPELRRALAEADAANDQP